jgi:hypothetical protein
MHFTQPPPTGGHAPQLRLQAGHLRGQARAALLLGRQRALHGVHILLLLVTDAPRPTRAPVALALPRCLAHAPMSMGMSMSMSMRVHRRQGEREGRPKRASARQRERDHLTQLVRCCARFLDFGGPQNLTPFGYGRDIQPSGEYLSG